MRVQEQERQRLVPGQGLQRRMVLEQGRQSHQMLVPGQGLQRPALERNQTNRLWERVLGIQNHRELQSHRVPQLRFPFLYFLDCNLRALILQRILCCIVAWPKWNAK